MTNSKKNTAAQKNGAKNSKNSKNSSKKGKKKKPNAFKRLFAGIILLMVLAVVFGVSFIWTDEINLALGLTKTEESAYGGESTDGVLTVAGDTSDKALTVHFVDVGQGDATIIEFPDGKKMIIDGGKDKEKQKLLTYIDEKIDSADKTMKNAKNSGGYGFDYAILTHADEDHCGGLDDVLTTYAAKVFYRPNELASYNNYLDPGKNNLISGYTSQSTLAYMKTLEAGYGSSKNVYINGDTRKNAEGADTTIIKSNEPDSPLYYELVFYTPILNSYTDRNDYSPIMILTYQNRRIVLSGDAEKTATEEFLTAVSTKAGKFSIFSDSFTVDVIKLGHHGSKTSSSEDFLEALTTSASRENVLAVISCGFNNSYKHPHKEVLDRLKSMGFKDENILRTDVNSTIVLAVKGGTAGLDGTLYFGADVVKTQVPAMSVGTINMQWREICITLWIMIAAVVVVQPVLKNNNKKRRANYK